MRAFIASLSGVLLALAGLSVQAVLRPATHGDAPSSQDAARHVRRDETYRFRRPQTERFLVDSANIPNITWDLGENYAGLLPVTSLNNGTRSLFFWFFPTTNQVAKKEIIIWLNGGPGCSSMEGFLQGNGPISWLPGTLNPVPNPYTWVNLTNVVWVDQPVSVGLSQGESDISDQYGLGKEFAGFWENFARTFALQGYKVYLTGESYAGMYIPYIVDAFLEKRNSTYFDVCGVALNDAFFGDPSMSMVVPMMPYVEHWQEVLSVNDTYMESLRAQAEHCGLPQYMDEWLTFPPQSRLSPEVNYNNIADISAECNLLNGIVTAARAVNPCFNWYRITDSCPFPLSVLGTPAGTTIPRSGAEPYFDDPDVLRALHVPIWTRWEQCKSAVFRDRATGELVTSDPYSDLPTLNGLFQRMIEHTNNVILGSGGFDMLLPTNGTLLVLQNLTWNGGRGFQEYPSKELYTPAKQDINSVVESSAGELGTWTAERGLTFYQVPNGGHTLPRDAPGTVYRVVEYMLGRVPSLDATFPEFTT